MKQTTILTFLLIILTSAFGQNQDQINGYVWREWTRQEKLIFINGFILSNYASLSYLNNNDIIRNEKWAEFAEIDLGGLPAGRLVDEVTQFYRQTGIYEAPLWIVIFIRNIWKSVPRDSIGDLFV
jgi:hypothetical protein